MPDRLLNWTRRALAVAALAALLLPLVTARGCQTSHTYRGWEAISEAPALAAIPVFFAAALVLTFLSRRVRTAIGRLVFLLFRIAGVAFAGAWTAVAFSTLPDCHDVSPESGGWVILGAAIGILACDTVEAARNWSAWRRWMRAHPVPLLEDRLLRAAAWVVAGAGGILTVLMVGLVGLYFEWPEWLRNNCLVLLTVSVFVLSVPWWALAHLAGWGLRRGLGWAKTLQHVGAFLTLAFLTPWAYTLTVHLAAALWEPEVEAEPVAVVLYPVILAWFAVTGWTVWVVLGARRRLLPSRTVRLPAAGGPRRVRIPLCPDCGARLWLAPDAAHLVCRPCGKTHAAAIADGAAIMVDTPPASV